MFGHPAERPLTPLCPNCRSTTRPHCQPLNSCGWRVCINSRCGAFGDPVKRRWTPSKPWTEEGTQ